MTLTRRMAGTGLALAAAALVLAAMAAPASAQTPPYTAYGTGVEPGATIGWTLDGEVCDTVTADADGQWLLYVETTEACPVSEGDTVGFAVDGAPAAETIVFAPGGAPDDVEAGIALVAAEEPAEPAEPAPPAPAPTGDAGLLGGGAGTPAALIALLALAAAVLVAGARTVTRRA